MIGKQTNLFKIFFNLEKKIYLVINRAYKHQNDAAILPVSFYLPQTICDNCMYNKDLESDKLGNLHLLLTN